MRTSRAVLASTAFVLLLGHATAVHADPIQWTYTWSRSPADVMADSPGTGYISLTDEPTVQAAGNTDIVATNLKTHSTASSSNPDVYTNKDYTVTLTITDQASGKSGTMVFHGLLNGTVTANSSNIKNQFIGDTEQKLVLGSTVYKVTIGPYVPPGPPNSGNSGSVGAHADALVTVQSLPEPGTLVLSLSGVLVLVLGRGARRRRRRRRARKEEPNPADEHVCAAS
jgi:hypothetical protein